MLHRGAGVCIGLYCEGRTETPPPSPPKLCAFENLPREQVCHPQDYGGCSSVDVADLSSRSPRAVRGPDGPAVGPVPAVSPAQALYVCWRLRLVTPARVASPGAVTQRLPEPGWRGRGDSPQVTRQMPGGAEGRPHGCAQGHALEPWPEFKTKSSGRARVPLGAAAMAAVSPAQGVCKRAYPVCLASRL